MPVTEMVIIVREPNRSVRTPACAVNNSVEMPKTVNERPTGRRRSGHLDDVPAERRDEDEVPGRRQQHRADEGPERREAQGRPADAIEEELTGRAARRRDVGEDLGETVTDADAHRPSVSHTGVRARSCSATLTRRDDRPSLGHRHEALARHVGRDVARRCRRRRVGGDDPSTRWRRVPRSSWAPRLRSSWRPGRWATSSGSWPRSLGAARSSPPPMSTSSRARRRGTPWWPERPCAGSLARRRDVRSRGAAGCVPLGRRP